MGIAYIPDEAIRARLFGNRWAFLPGLLFFFLRIEGFIHIGWRICEGWWFSSVWRFRLDLAGECANFFALGIQECQFHLSFGLFFEIITDNNTVGWILSGIKIAFHLFAALLLLNASGYHRSSCAAGIFHRFWCPCIAIVGHETNGGTRREKEGRTVFYILTGLAQRRDVIQNP